MCADAFAAGVFGSAGSNNTGWPGGYARGYWRGRLSFCAPEWARHINGEILNVNGGSGVVRVMNLYRRLSSLRTSLAKKSHEFNYSRK